MKTNTYKYFSFALITIFLVACSTKKNNFLSRNTHALSTKYNILYNGQVALDKGIVDLKTQYKDNYWEILPVERMVTLRDPNLPADTKNQNFDRAEEKAAKAIQKHSMNIDGSEKNPQMDEAHLLLGKTRYYENRFVPALEAFNYVLYKYPTSDKIYEVKIWREKTNMRLDNDEQAITNLRKLLKEIKFKDQIYADANATLAQAFLNIEQKDSAVAKIKIAKEFTKSKEEIARYNFILGQLYDDLGHKDSAFAVYQDVIDMNRKSPRVYVMQSHAKQALHFDYKNGDTIAFVKKFKDLLENRENRPYLDVLNHHMGFFYDKLNKKEHAVKYYNKSLDANSQDNYLIASNYRNLADINFKNAKYVVCGKYFDSTLAVLNPRSREYKLISKKRENLEDVIKYEDIAQRNDSILKISSMSKDNQEKFYNDYLIKLKAEELKKKELAEKLEKEQQILEENNEKEVVQGKSSTKIDMPKTSGKNTDFYFYNPTAVAYGREEFLKKWGKREHGPNWRYSGLQTSKSASNPEKEDEKANDIAVKEDKGLDPSFFINQLPSSQKELDSIARERNFAYYQLGVIYKEKFKEYPLAADKFEIVLDKNPEERLVLPSLYNLFKIYEIIDASKAAQIKNQIIAEHPSSRYAQILSDNKVSLELGKPEVVYANLYKDYESGLYRETLVKTDMAIVEFTGEELLPKFELLKANLIGKIYGLAEYKKALNFVALTYPNTQEGKETEEFIAAKIPFLESLYFNDEVPVSWKIVYQPKTLNKADYKILLEKLNKLAKERTIEKLFVSIDVYTLERNLIVLHGIKSEENAKGLAQVLKEFKEYKVQDPATVISSENYKIVQIFKNLEEYIAGKGPNFEPKPKQSISLPKAEVKPEKPLAIRQPKPQQQTRDSKENTQMLQMSDTKNVKTDDAPGQNMMPPSAPESPKKGN